MSAAAVFALFCVGFAALQMREAAVSAANDTELLTARAVVLSEQGSEVTEQVRQFLRDARLTLSDVNKAAIAERLYAENDLPDTVDRVNRVLDAAQQTVAGLQTTEHAANVALGALDQPIGNAVQVEGSANALLLQLLQVSQHADLVVSNPHITSSLANADVATAAAASTLQHTDATAADTQQAWHSVLHPSWPHRIGRALRHLF